jgi:hypothetical protein
MRQTWRWFGPADPVSIDDMLQAGVEGVVTALHQVATGAVWTPDAITGRQRDLARMSDGAPSGLAWEVVGSLPVSEAIKKQKDPWREHIAAYKTSLRNLAAALAVQRSPSGQNRPESPVGPTMTGRLSLLPKSSIERSRPAAPFSGRGRSAMPSKAVSLRLSVVSSSAPPSAKSNTARGSAAHASPRMASIL